MPRLTSGMPVQRSLLRSFAWGSGLLLISLVVGGRLVAGRQTPLPRQASGADGPFAREASPFLIRREVPLEQACRQIGVRYPPPDLHLKVRKGRRRLTVFSGTRLVKEFPIALGGSPTGDKVREGDGKTPEGTFYICTRVPRSRFHRFAGISYPNRDDAQRGLRSGLITPSQARAVEAAQRRRRLPPWDTALGGAVGIHGGGAGSDWTLGCIALDNTDVDELFPLLTLGTPVTIEP